MKKESAGAIKLLRICGTILMVMAVYSIFALTYIVLSKTSPEAFSQLSQTLNLLTILLASLSIGVGLFIIGHLENLRLLKIYSILFPLAYFLLALLSYVWLNFPRNQVTTWAYTVIWPIFGIISIILGINMLVTKKQFGNASLILGILLIIDGIYFIVAVVNSFLILLQACVFSIVLLLFGLLFLKVSEKFEEKRSSTRE